MDAEKANYFYGWRAGANVLANALGNSGFGYGVLRNTTSGSWNTAMGLDALGRNKVGRDATAIGQSSHLAIEHLQIIAGVAVRWQLIIRLLLAILLLMEL